MPLNYSKWDNLELSDDSDIEGHPNVDKKSLIRWKQRDIHEKRQMRNHQIQQLEADLLVHEALVPRVQKIARELSAADDAPAYFSRIVDQLGTQPGPDAPPGSDLKYDTMVHTLLVKVSDEAKAKGYERSDPRLGEALVGGMKTHLEELQGEIKKKKDELVKEQQEKSKKITTEDIHEGWESKYTPAKPEPPPLPGASVPKKAKKTEVEVLNPKGVAAASSSSSTAAAPSADDSEPEDDSGLPQMTPALEAFSQIPYASFARSFEYIQGHREVVVPGAADALLVAAFNAQGEGKAKYAKQCVHQSLLLQYCEKLGGDGVRVFFGKMVSGDARATSVFLQDVEQTYTHLVSRVQAAKKEEEAAAAGVEQIQLVPEGDGQAITFNVPDGPPPAELRLEGPGTEGLDIEEVRKALQLRWTVFEGFPDDLKEALKANELEKVNKVLGRMSIDEAESVVEQLQIAGILNFADGGIRDETGKLDDADEEEDTEEDEEETKAPAS